MIRIYFALLFCAAFLACAHKPKPEIPPCMGSGCVNVGLLDTLTYNDGHNFHEKDAVSDRFFAEGFFEFDSDTLTASGWFIVDGASKFLVDHPFYQVHVYGYADTTGREGYNDSLSKRRADRIFSAIASTSTGGVILGKAIGRGELRGNAARARRATIRINK